MRISRPVCLTCHHRLTAKAAGHVAQWHSQAAYSAWPAPAAGEPRRDGLATGPEARGSMGRDSQGESQPRFTRYLADDKRPKIKPTTTAPRPGRKQIGAKPKVDMDALFQRIVDRKDDDGSDTGGAIRMPTLDIQLVHDVGNLQQLLDKNVPIGQAFTYLKTQLYPAICREGAYIPQVFFNVASAVIDRTFKAKKKDTWNGDLPRVADILSISANVGALKPADCFALVEELVVYLCQMDTASADYPTIEAYERHLATRDMAIADLVDSWKILTLPKSMVGKQRNPDDDMLDAFWFPRLDKVATNKFFKSNNFTLAFMSLFPQYPQNQLGDKPSVLAVATFMLLLDTTRSNTSARQKASRFIAKIANLMIIVGVDRTALRNAAVATLPSIAGYISAQWPKIEQHLRELSDAPKNRPEGLQRSHEPGPSSSRDHLGSNTFIKRLNSAYLTRNGREVTKLWEEFIAVPHKESSARRAAELRKQTDIFHFFIKIYMALNNPDKAIEVWNYLPRVGLKPSLKTWNVMLDGCKEARNVFGLRLVWERLVASGVQLDVAVWTTRIAGLMHCDDPKGAVDALEEMAQRWDQAKRQGDTTRAVEPTTQPVNAALQGLIRLGNLGATKQLLSWARGRGIKPDVFTFNLLLRPALLNGHDKEVAAIFKSMKALGVEADAATFTVILDGMLSYSHADDPKEQEKVVKTVFDNMERAGLEANLQTYGKTIHLLLRAGDRAQASVKYVMEHLFNRGLELSPHIYTILVEHYFSRNPPDLEAVDSLLQRRRLLDYDDMDRVFYDCVIKGYAQVGEIDTAFGIYQKLASAGVHVNLVALVELLVGLVKTERLEDAKILVDDTTKKYLEQYGESSWRAHSFWYVASQLGFIDWVQTEVGGRAILREIE